MCCRSDLCYRINCHCVCFRCRNCDDCARIFGKGGIAFHLTADTGFLSRMAGSVIRYGNKVKPTKYHHPTEPSAVSNPAVSPPPTSSNIPVSPAITPSHPTETSTSRTNHASAMIRSVSEECCIQ